MKRASRRLAVLAAICATGTGIVLALYWAGFAPLTNSEFYTQDLRARIGRLAPRDDRLVFIGIDRASYSDVPLEKDEEALADPVIRMLRGNFPWSREVWAELADRLARAGARAVLLDLLFAAEGPGDDRLAGSLERHKDKVALGSNFSDVQAEQGFYLQHIVPSKSILTAAAGGDIAADPRVGFVNVWADADGIVRRARFRVSERSFAGLEADAPSGVHYESLAARGLRLAGHGDRIPPGEGMHLFRFTGAPGRGFPPHSIRDVLSARTWQKNFGDGAFFRDKIVLIGPSANFFHDEHPTPFAHPDTRMLGPEIHLNIINAALHGQFLRETPMLVDALFLLAAGAVVFLLHLRVGQHVFRVFAVAGVGVIWLLACQLAFDRGSLVLPAVGPLAVLALCGGATLVYDSLLEGLERRRTRRTLERYVSRNLVQELLDNPQSFATSLGGVRRSVTVLFSDVREFTSLTESSNEILLVRQLNEYFTQMVNAVFEHEGTLDKFIGDGLMAVWGNIVSHGKERDAQNAVATALAMRRKLDELNRRWQERGWPALSMGIGINHGEAIVGNLGSMEKMELTVIGDAVNTASRVEGLTKFYKTDLLLGASMSVLVRDRFFLRTVDYIKVKGRSLPLEVFTVAGERTAEDAKAPPWLAIHEAAIERFRAEDYHGAAREFERLCHCKPDDPLAQLYLERCRVLIDNPFAEGWSGLFVAGSK